MTRILIVFCVPWALSGCGGGGGGQDPVGGTVAPPDPRLAVIDAFDQQLQRVQILPATDPATLPTSGTLDFEGAASIRAETAPVSAVLLGEASVVAHFADNTVTGRMANFFGTDPNGQVRNYAGTLLLNNGQTGGAAENSWTADYSGSLASGGDELIFDGTITGEFLGQPVAAVTGTDLEVGLRYNGRATDATLVLIGERD